MSVEEASCRINFNASELNVTEKENGFKGIQIKKFKIKGNITYSIMNISALVPEPLSLSFEKLVPSVQFSVSKFNFNSKKGNAISIGKTGLWYYQNILSESNELSQETIGTVENLISNTDDSLEKTKLIYEYVENNFEYIKLDLAFGNYIPASVLKVSEVKKGDAKSLINFTRVLLNHFGIESYFTFVHAGIEEYNFENNFASLVQGNHVILCVPINGELYWIDYSSDSKPFNFIGRSIDNRDVLVIKPTGGEIVKTPAYGSEDNYKKTEADCYIADNGGIKVKVTIRSGGVEYSKRLRFRSGLKKLILKKYEEEWGHIENIVINDFSFVENHKELIEKVDISGSNYGSIMTNMMMFSVNIFNKELFKLESFSERKSPIVIQHSIFQQDIIRVHVPNGYKLRTLPKDKIIENKYGKFKIHFEKGENNEVLYKRELYINKGLYNKEEYGAFLKFNDRVQFVEGIQLEFIKA